jgi:rubrerythrin
VREQYEEDQANLPPLSVEDWNAQYEQLMQELNEYLARELLESTAQDEAYHFERYQRSSEQEGEYLSQIYNESASHTASLFSTCPDRMYVCAVCKSLVHRIQDTTRVVCERRGCVDLDMKVRLSCTL